MAMHSPAKIVGFVREHLERDRQMRRPDHAVPCRLGLSAGSRSLLHHLTSHRLTELVQDARKLLDTLAELRQEGEDLERRPARAGRC
jgi:hypothetical protein